MNFDELAHHPVLFGSDGRADLDAAPQAEQRGELPPLDQHGRLELPAADAALVEVLACGECFVRVAVHDHRLLLSRDAPGDVADIPCAQLVFAEDALVGSVMVAGFEVEGLRIPVDDPPPSRLFLDESKLWTATRPSGHDRPS